MSDTKKISKQNKRLWCKSEIKQTPQLNKIKTKFAIGKIAIKL